MTDDVSQRVDWAPVSSYSPGVGEEIDDTGTGMAELDRGRDIEALARIAARLAGRDPDEHIKVELGKMVAFDGQAWRYPDFLARAKEAYRVLNTHCDPLKPMSAKRR
jgi:hypothetical protein